MQEVNPAKEITKVCIKQIKEILISKIEDKNKQILARLDLIEFYVKEF